MISFPRPGVTIGYLLALLPKRFNILLEVDFVFFL